jgi:hypothetical protein
MIEADWPGEKDQVLYRRKIMAVPTISRLLISLRSLRDNATSHKGRYWFHNVKEDSVAGYR